MKNFIITALASMLTCMAVSSVAEVKETVTQAIPHSSYVAFCGQVALPIEGEWRARSSSDEFVKKYKLTIRPVRKQSDEQAKAHRTDFLYSVVAVRNSDSLDPFQLTVDNPISGQQRTITWDPKGAKQDEGVLFTLRAARSYAWQPDLDAGPAPVLNMWVSSTESRKSSPLPTWRR